MKPAPPVIRTCCNLLNGCAVSGCAGANVLIVSSTRQAGECGPRVRILRRIEVAVRTEASAGSATRGAGTPAAMARSGMSRFTTAPAPMIECAPT